MYIDPAALILVLLIAMGIGMALAGAAYALRLINHRLDELEAVVDKRRHTHPTTAGIEDATAVFVELARREEDEWLRLQAEAKYRHDRLRQGYEILGRVREGPLAYDAERPADRPPRPDGRGKR